jgi:hypothetical protein
VKNMEKNMEIKMENTKTKKTKVKYE